MSKLRLSIFLTSIVLLSGCGSSSTPQDASSIKDDKIGDGIVAPQAGQVDCTFVRYEDPDAPCIEGLVDGSAEVDSQQEIEFLSEMDEQQQQAVLNALREQVRSAIDCDNVDDPEEGVNCVENAE